MKIAITGHRPNKLGNDYELKSPLILSIRAMLIQLIMKDSGTNELRNPDDLTLITGMASRSTTDY